MQFPIIIFLTSITNHFGILQVIKRGCQRYFVGSKKICIWLMNDDDDDDDDELFLWYG